MRGLSLVLALALCWMSHGLKLPFGARAKSPLIQVTIGAVSALAVGFLQRVFWNNVGYHHLIVQIPAVVVATFYGGGAWAGVAASAVAVAVWGVFFHPLLHTEGGLTASDWADILAFLFSASWVTVLGSQRILQLYGRAEELERLHYAVLAAKVGIWEWDITRNRLEWNDQMLELYGITRDRFRGDYNAWYSGVHPEDQAEAGRAIAQAIEGKKDYDIQFRTIHPDGSIRFVHASAIIRRDGSGKPLVMYGMNQDVTKQVQAIESLQQMNAYFQAAMDQSQVGIVIADAPSGRIRFCNDAALAIPGRPREELVERSDISHYQSWNITQVDGSPIPSEETPLSRSLLKGEPVRAEIAITNVRGERRIVLTNTAPIRRSDGSILAAIAVFFDNTESHRLMAQLERAKQAAEVASLAKSRFLDIAAHELRTPVTAFSLLLQLTQRQLASGKVVEMSTLERLRAQVDRLSRLVVDLLEVSRLDRGMLILKREQKDIGHLVQECIANFRLQFPDREFRLTGNGRRVEAEFDSVRIYEVISNLLDNAIKYTPAEAPIELVFADDSERVRVSIRDWGPGIPAERQEFLFRPFERGETADEEQHAGLGLGLYICRKIIELHGGTISVDSRPGEGSTFGFEIPKRPAFTRGRTEVA
jgi:PAS domain S-box-containing protein